MSPCDRRSSRRPLFVGISVSTAAALGTASVLALWYEANGAISSSSSSSALPAAWSDVSPELLLPSGCQGEDSKASEECQAELRRLRSKAAGPPPQDVFDDWFDHNQFEDPSVKVTTQAPTTTTKTEKKEVFTGDEFDDWEKDLQNIERGPFCCQNGQGMGATDDSDPGATCYPSAKPEPYDYCDDQDICNEFCNGTWVLGWCALKTEGVAEDSKTRCSLELNEKGTTYSYVSQADRAIMDDDCAGSRSECEACEGHWCEYVKAPIY